MAADNSSDLDKSTASNQTDTLQKKAGDNSGDLSSEKSGGNSGGNSGAMSGRMSEKTVGRLKLASGIMGVLIILCLILLIYGISQKAGELFSGGEAPTETVIAAPATLIDNLELPAGMVLRSIAPALNGGLWLFAEKQETQYLLRLNGFGEVVQQLQLSSSK